MKRIQYYPGLSLEAINVFITVNCILSLSFAMNDSYKVYRYNYR